ncbi:hypothetical protein LXA43DRAFT_1099766 [Ganoderma leucocontextum]|nr:hypothetical protein LXA43DRAFT_1099766 [Ganoderma leucocontextum]
MRTTRAKAAKADDNTSSPAAATFRDNESPPALTTPSAESSSTLSTTTAIEGGAQLATTVIDDAVNELTVPFHGTTANGCLVSGIEGSGPPAVVDKLPQNGSGTSTTTEVGGVIITDNVVNNPAVSGMASVFPTTVFNAPAAAATSTSADAMPFPMSITDVAVAASSPATTVDHGSLTVTNKVTENDITATNAGSLTVTDNVITNLPVSGTPTDATPSGPPSPFTMHGVPLPALFDSASSLPSCNFLSREAIQALAAMLSSNVVPGVSLQAPPGIQPATAPGPTVNAAPAPLPATDAVPTTNATNTVPGTSTTPALPIPNNAGVATTTAPSTVITPTVASRFVDDPSFSAAFGVSDGPLGPSAAQLAEKLENVRAVARERDFYLACGAHTIDRVTWFEDGNSHIVVEKVQGFTTMEARAAHAAHPLLNPKPPLPDLAHVYMIGTVASNCCFLHCDGNYKKDGPSARFTRGFAGTTLACALVAPPAHYPALVEDHARAMDTVSSILKHFEQPWAGFSFEKQKFMTEQHIRLRHKVFQKKSSANDVAPTAGLPAQFQIASWPVNDDAKPLLAALVPSHFTKPLPAFDVNANLIAPDKYMDELKGAMVLVGFSLLQYYIDAKHNMCLDIEYMRVLIPGNGEQRAPQKRSAVQMTDPFSRAGEKCRAV